MSSDIFSRPIDVSKYGMIYGGAQKNLSMAGVTFCIIKEDLVGKVSRTIPTMLNYQTHISKGSMFNTPPTVPIYCALQNLKWIKKQGGVKEMERRAIERAEIVYGKRYPGFRHTDGSCSLICGICHQQGYGRRQGTPRRRRIPRQLLQRHGPRGRQRTRGLHEGI